MRRLILLPLVAAALLVGCDRIPDDSKPICQVNDAYWTNCIGEKEYTRGKYVGEWRGNFHDGQGTYFFVSGSVKYKGEWKGGRHHGQGTEYYPHDGIRYKGEWKGGRHHGQGTAYYSDGNIFHQGEWCNGEPGPCK